MYKIQRIWIRLLEYVHAVQDYPKGIVCGWCGGFNFFYDDIGFFCITPQGNDNRVTCRHCYDSELGEAHIARYGVGER